MERLRSGPKLRRLCAWERACDAPREATFCARSGSLRRLLYRADARGVNESPYAKEIVGQISRSCDDNREAGEADAGGNGVGTPEAEAGASSQGGRTSKESVGASARDESVGDAGHAAGAVCGGCPAQCQGLRGWWTGCRLHMDVADGGIQLSGQFYRRGWFTTTRTQSNCG